LLHFDKNKKENHNVYKTAVKGLWTVYTKNGIEKTNDADYIIEETKKFVNLIIEKYGKQFKSKYLLNKAREEIFYDVGGRQGYDREGFLKDLEQLFSNEVPLLFYNKRHIAMGTISEL
jgi:hypothetical protein